MRAVATLVAKDLRLLWRDRAGLVFLLIAPLLVITVAGFSLANLYGADPTGQTAYEFPLVDEDAGSLGATIRGRLADEPGVRVEGVPDRATARTWVRDRKRAGTALIIPAGTDERLAAGEPVSLVLYTDAVKYLERLNVRLRLLEIVQAEADQRRDAAVREARAQRERLGAEVERLRATMTNTRAALETSWADADRARTQALRRLEEGVARARQAAQERLARELAQRRTQLEREIEAQVRAVRAPMQSYVATVRERRAAFERWIVRLRELAGSRAAAIPEPPTFPELPAALVRFLEDDHPLVTLPPFDAASLSMPAPSPLSLPPLPAMPVIATPTIALPPPPVVPGTLHITEEPVGGGSSSINTFDQNVPGFSVTFLLLGMLLGVSLGLLDEREWGTLDRLRAMPVSLAHVLVAKLLSRFMVGVVQMVVLLAFGRIAFGISLGPQPWALLLPIVGIVFAGTAFGLVVAGVATSREAVLPVGSMVIVTMAAVGGCWWPIDLEPRWMRTVALALPTTWAMEAFNDLMIRHRTVEEVLQPTGVMLAYGLLYLMVGLGLFQWRARDLP